MADRAQYATTPRYSNVLCSVPNTSYDGSGTIVTLFTAGVNGSRLDGIGWAAQGDTVAGRLNLFMRASSSDTWRFLAGFEIPALTVSEIQPAASGGWANSGLVLAAGVQIGVAATVSGNFMVHTPNAADF